MELNVSTALGGDTAAISALRCLRLYLRRLGPDPFTGRQVQVGELPLAHCRTP